MRAVLLTLLFPTLALAQPQATVVDFGVICKIEPTGQRPAPLTESGVLNIVNQDRDFDMTTTVVPARQGISFGVKVQLAQGETQGRIVVTHPPMGASGVTVESWGAKLGAGASNLNLFTFEHAYELVEGRWTFAVFADGIKLTEHSFEVVPEQAAPKVAGLCFGQDYLS